MKVIITGGGGFLGSRLCHAILQRGNLTGPSAGPEPIEEIILLDTRFPALPAPDRVRQVVVDMADQEGLFEAIGTTPDTSLFHLASMVSGECEERFDDALRTNLDGGRHVFEAARRIPGRPRLVFAGSIACFGGPAVRERLSDASKPLPQTTYGMTKAICELLVNDHSRKGHFDGRTARLPTVIIRPGRPNAAASSWASGMFREPLNGEPCDLPVHRSQRHPMTGYRTVIDSFISLHEMSGECLGPDRACGLPAHSVTPEMAAAVLQELAEERGLEPGPIRDAFDPRIQGIVDNWPTAIDGSRAVQLGLPSPPPLKRIVEEYLADYPNP